MIKTHHLLIFFLSLSSVLSAQTEFKFNTISATILVPNFGIEVSLAKHKTIQLDVLGSFWDSFNNKPLQATQIFPEFRYYQYKNNTGCFIGAHVGFGMFTLQKPSFPIIYDKYQNPSTYYQGENEYKSGRITFYGLTIGYKKYINSHWGIEAFLGGGLSQSKYKGYYGFERVDILPTDKYISFNGSGEVLLYRGGIMLIYKLRPINIQ
jgi:hypothetical protein